MAHTVNLKCHFPNLKECGLGRHLQIRPLCAFESLIHTILVTSDPRRFSSDAYNTLRVLHTRGRRVQGVVGV